MSESVQKHEGQSSQAIERLSKPAIWIFGATILGRMLGFVRESTLAAFFGVGPEVDAFIMAQTVTYILFSFLGPAIGTAGIPVLSVLHADRRVEAFRNVSLSLLHVVVIVLIGFTLVGYSMAPLLIHTIAPGFTGHQAELAIHLTRMMMPVTIFLGLAGWATTVLQSQNKFGYSALSNIPNNAVVIVGMFAAGFLGGIEWVTVCYVLGVAAQFLIQLPVFKTTGYKWFINLKDKDFKKIITMAPSTIATGMGGQINVIVDRFFSSGLAVGSVAALGYGQRIFSLFVGVVQMPILVVLFPKLSEKVGLGKEEEFMHLIRKGLGILSFFMLPIAAILVLMAIPITQFLYERGAFNQTATLITASIVCFYSMGLPFLSWKEFILRSFYAMKDSRTPVLNTTMQIGINVTLNSLSVPVFGIKGLALSTAISEMVSFFVLYNVLRRRMYKKTGVKAAHFPFWKSLVSAGAMVAVIFGMSNLLDLHLFDRTVQSSFALALDLGLIVIASGIAYLVVSLLLKSDEMLFCLKTALHMGSKFLPSKVSGYVMAKARMNRVPKRNM